MMKETIFVAVVLVLSACAAGTTGTNYGPLYTYNEVLVINNSQELIRNEIGRAHV
jgi:hypothetical protein